MPVTINGTTGIVTPALVNGTALSFRNKIINGNFGINQRAYVSGTATSGANQYTLDRWRVVTSGQNLTFSASGTGNIVTAPAGGIEQVIESLNIEGGTYTLSWTGTATATINGSAIANGGQATLPANTNATIKFSSGTVSLVQLEAGSVATPFENRPIGTELQLCKRYFEIWGSNHPLPLPQPYQSTVDRIPGIQWEVEKRAIPTITFSSVTACFVGQIPGGGNVTISNTEAATLSIWGASYFAVTHSATSGINRYNVDAGQFVAISSEL